MIKDKFIVCVNASFEGREALMSTIRKYSQYSDERFGYWDEFAFTSQRLTECDAILTFNTPFEKISVTCFRENNIAFMMEPGVRWRHPWMFKELDQFHKVYSPIQQSANTVLSHGFLGWYFHHDYNYLKNLAIPAKTKAVSCIASGLAQLKGHRLRLNFIKLLQQRLPQIDFFGKGSNFLPDKLDGLLPYRYSVAIENNSSPHYFTEKINDCFLSYTVPLYYGCTNIGEYFPANSFIVIDIQNPEKTIRQIEDVLLHDDWSSRLAAVKEARNLVLNKYQPLAGAADVFRQIRPSSEKAPINLKPVHPGLLEGISKAIINWQKAKQVADKYRKSIASFMNKKIIKDISASTAQVILNQVLGLVIFFITSRYLAKTVYGEMNWSLALLTFVTSVLSLRLEQIVVRRVAAGQNPSKLLTLFSGHLIFTGLLFYAVLLAGSVLFPSFFRRHDLLLILAISQLLTFFSSPFKQLANGKENFRFLAIMSSIANIVRSVWLLLVVLFSTLTIQWVLVIYIFSSFAELAICFYLANYRMKTTFSTQHGIKDYFILIRESLPQAGVVILSASIARIDWILLGLFTTAEKTAEYSFAYKVFELSPFPMLIIAPVLLSRFSRFFRNNTEQDLLVEKTGASAC